MFSEYLGIIDAIAKLNGNATVGNIQRMNSHMTAGQVKRRLNSLVGEGYVDFARVEYGRTGKIVYYLKNLCVTNVHITSKAIEDAGYLSSADVA